MSDNFNIVRVKGTPKYMEFEGGLRIYRPDKDPVTGKESVYFLGPGWNRWVMCADYGNHFVTKNPYFADPKYPGMNSVFAFCSCGSQAVVTGYQQYAEGFSASDGGKNFMKGEMLVCKEFTDNLVEHGNGRHLDGSS